MAACFLGGQAAGQQSRFDSGPNSSASWSWSIPVLSLSFLSTYKVGGELHDSKMSEFQDKSWREVPGIQAGALDGKMFPWDRKIERSHLRIQIIFEKASCPGSVEKTFYPREREMMNTSQCWFSKGLWFSTRNLGSWKVRLSRLLFKQWGGSSHLRQSVWHAGCPELSALPEKVKISFSPTTQRQAASSYIQGRWTVHWGIQ